MSIEDTTAHLQAVAAGLDQIFNGDHKPPINGFALFVFPFNDQPTDVNYVSNATRESMIVALKEWLRRQEN